MIPPSDSPSNSASASNASAPSSPTGDANSAAFSVLALIDDSLSRERRAGVLNFLRLLKSGPPRAAVEVLQNPGISEDELIRLIGGRSLNVLLLPWRRALAWRRLEGHLGVKRTQGTIVIGYFAEPVRPFELEYPLQGRRIALLDLHRTSSSQAMAMVRSLAINGIRSGLPGLFAMANQVGESSAVIQNSQDEGGRRLSFRSCPTIHGCDWGAGISLGRVIEAIDRLPLLETWPWSGRKLEIRQAATALWTLVFEEGPGRSGFSLQQQAAAGKALARFETAWNERILAFRLHYVHPRYKAPDVLAAFWPNPQIPKEAGIEALEDFSVVSSDSLSSIHSTHAPTRDFRMDRACGLLHRYADFLRVLYFEESSRIEIIAGFLDTAPARVATDELHGVFIEPLSEHLFFENQSGALAAVKREELFLPGRFDRLSGAGGAASEGGASGAELKALRAHAGLLEARLEQLEADLRDREEKLEEMRLGGILSGGAALAAKTGAASTGTGGAPLLGPDFETLLESLELRYRDYELQIASLQNEILAAERGRDPALAGFLRDARRKISSLQIRRGAALDQLRGLPGKLERSARPVKQ